MNESREPEVIEDEAVTSETLRSIDPVDAPDVVEGLASSLQKELDQAGPPKDSSERERL